MKMTKRMKLLNVISSRLTIRGRFLYWILLSSFTICITLQFSGASRDLEDYLGRTALFRLRSKLALDPVLHPNIVIYAYDDDALYEWGRPERLKGQRWAEMIEAISSHRPRAIFIDAAFLTNKHEPSDLLALNNAFSTATPVFSGAVIRSQPIENRETFNMSDDVYTAPVAEFDFIQEYLAQTLSSVVYGPAENLPKLHKTLGHQKYLPPGYFMPIAPISREKRLKNLAFANPDIAQLEFKGKDLYVNGALVPLNDYGEAIVNWSNAAQYRSRMFKILDLVKMKRSNVLSKKINNDSVVILLPSMYTGVSTLLETFGGRMESGYALVAVMNSVLSGAWVRVVDLSYGGILVFLILASFGAFFRKNYKLWWYGLTVNIVLLISCGALFLLKGLLIAWINPFLAFNLTFIPLILTATIASEKRAIQINEALKGVLPPRLIELVNKDPGSFSIQPVEQIVTVMFVDFVGFSSVAERLASRAVFETLKSHLSDLSKIIHRYNGIVDKSLGDGVLGVFGFDPVTKKIDDSHATSAMLAAIEIQRLMADECARYRQADSSVDHVIFACRVGLNTGAVFIGNVGDAERFDLTVIGNTVNLAKRFEDACEPFKILIGLNTQHYLDVSIRQKLLLRLIQIKHHKELIDSFEFDPFTEETALYLKALDGYRLFANISRSEDRRLVGPEQTWELIQDGQNVGLVLDYSRKGLRAELSNYYGNKVVLRFDLLISSSLTGQVLREVKGLVCTVKWGRSSDKSFMHGLEFSEESMTKFSSAFSLGQTTDT